MTDATNVRLSNKEALILRLLITSGGEMYGLEMVQKSDRGLARGTVYVTLERMAERGLVESRQEDKPSHVPGIPRRLYKPSGVGERVYRAWERMQDAGGRLVPAFGS
jgi:DNA-binding PadR family transcriptional regulator